MEKKAVLISEVQTDQLETVSENRPYDIRLLCFDLGDNTCSHVVYFCFCFCFDDYL